MPRKFPDSYSLYDSVYGSEYPTEQYFIILFDALPSKYSNNNFYDKSIKLYLISNGFIEESNINTTNRKFDISSQSLFINKNKNIFVTIHGTNEDKYGLVQLSVMYNIKNGILTNLFDWDEINKFIKTKKKSNINLVKSEMGHLDTEEYDLVSPDINLELNYGKEFVKIHDVIVSRLNSPKDKGIILLHGDPGTGKTSYLKYLTRLITDKDILFIPPSMAEMLSEPSIIPFLMEHKNSILIIEDAERVISDRETNGSSAGVSNILNLTDGILGDCLGIQVIATFNMKREKIDQALLRKGRLIAEHKFGKLTVDETNNLLKSLNKDYVSKEEMVLADIYNVDIELFKSVDKTNKIGFNKN
jgi:hypothetical protein